MAKQIYSDDGQRTIPDGDKKKYIKRKKLHKMEKPSGPFATESSIPEDGRT